MRRWSSQAGGFGWGLMHAFRFTGFLQGKLLPALVGIDSGGAAQRAGTKILCRPRIDPLNSLQGPFVMAAFAFHILYQRAAAPLHLL